MILKASQRGGGKQLALHLLKTEENEHVEVHEIRGFVSEDVVAAMKEAYAVSKGTRCKQFLFSVSLNPPESESVGIRTFENAADRIEKKTGLLGHPRVIVFHEKEGRRHAHVVWLRIDADSMTAKNLSHFKFKMRDLSRDLFLENEWKMPKGLMNSHASDPRNYTLEEYQQAKRMGQTGRDLKMMFQECWAISDSRAGFEAALSERGFILARGDRRGFVAVAPEGEVLSISRYVGKHVSIIRERLGDQNKLPSVNEARSRLIQDMSATFKRHVEETRSSKNIKLDELEARRQKLTVQHKQERDQLDNGQRQRWVEETRHRTVRLKTGLSGVWQRITGKRHHVIRQNVVDGIAAIKRDRDQRDNLVHAQLGDRRVLQDEIRNVRKQYAGLYGEIRSDRRKLIEANQDQETDSRKPRRRRRRNQDPTPEI